MIIPLLTGIKNMLLLLDFQSISMYCHAFKYIFLVPSDFSRVPEQLTGRFAQLNLGSYGNFSTKRRENSGPLISASVTMTKLTIDVQSIWESNQPGVNGRISDVSLKAQSHVINRFGFYYILHTTINWNLTIYPNLIPKLMLQSLNKFL